MEYVVALWLVWQHHAERLQVPVPVASVCLVII